jgi:hypothetical protein
VKSCDTQTYYRPACKPTISTRGASLQWTLGGALYRWLSETRTKKAKSFVKRPTQKGGRFHGHVKITAQHFAGTPSIWPPKRSPMPKILEERLVESLKRIRLGMQEISAYSCVWGSRKPGPSASGSRVGWGLLEAFWCGGTIELHWSSRKPITLSRESRLSTVRMDRSQPLILGVFRLQKNCPSDFSDRRYWALWIISAHSGA